MKSAAIQQRLGCLVLTGLAALAIASTAQAGVQVSFVGGGPRQGNNSFFGDTDGNTADFSQFNGPTALTMDSLGTLYLADRNNGKIRRITVPSSPASSQTTSLITGLNQPVAVVADQADNLYVLTQGDGLLRKYDRSGNFLSLVTNGLTGASALAIDNSTNLYVAIPGAGTSGGSIKRITRTNAVTLASGFNQPQGLVMLGNGVLALSDTGNHAIRTVNPTNGATTLFTGNNGLGFADGAKAFAKFNLPQGLAKSPSGTLVVADRMNHRLRLVDTNGTVSTLAGIDPTLWEPSIPAAGIYAGWADGDADVAEIREPAGVVVDTAGAVYMTELYYHLLRTVTGGPLGTGGSTTNTPPGTNAVVQLPAPVFTPTYGFYPLGQIITVAGDNPVYYTTDGTEPTTNSFLVGTNGLLYWRETLRDLTSLRLKAIDGTNASATVAGVPSPVNDLGVTRNMIAGSGSTVLIPIVMNLKPANQVRSLQYRIEITPSFGAPPIRPGFAALGMSSNDFVALAGASVAGTVGHYTSSAYSVGDTRGLVLTAIGTNANFQVLNFGTVALLAVPLDPNALPGQSYTVSILYPSASSDGGQTPVPLTAMGNRLIIVSNASYTVGDSSPGFWYGAGDFGDGDLNNNDVNNAFYASLGVRVPFDYTDVFDAMDAYPPDTSGSVGGDGQVRFLDWQIILMRALRLDTNNYKRFWVPGLGRGTDTNSLIQRASGTRAKSGPAPNPPGNVWLRQATITSQPMQLVPPGVSRSMPVIVKVAPGYSLAGLSFRAVLTADDGTTPVSGLVFTPAFGNPSPIQAPGLAGNELLCGWPLVPSPAFMPALTGSNLIGTIDFTVPTNAAPGRSYTLHFLNADGAPDIANQYNLESIPTALWVASEAQRPAELVSEQWKTNFFGSLTNPDADANADPDNDGVPNWKEYLAGTNPTNAQSQLRLIQTSAVTNAGFHGVRLRWLSAPGKLYQVDSSPSATATSWTPVLTDLLGDGTVREITVTNAMDRLRFYRLRVQTP